MTTAIGFTGSGEAPRLSDRRKLAPRVKLGERPAKLGDRHSSSSAPWPLKTSPERKGGLDARAAAASPWKEALLCRGLLPVLCPFKEALLWSWLLPRVTAPSSCVLARVEPRG
jgi:hypothetical protein